jgi:opacity protein-like surface antigen
MPLKTAICIFCNFLLQDTIHMKKILFTILLIASIQSGYAQWSREWSLGYSYAAPTGKMKQNITRSHGGVLDFHFLSPTGKLALGTDFIYSIYGFDKTTQQYMFPDGTTANMDIQVSNSFFNLMASGRYYLITGKKLMPYVGLKAGYSWFVTDLNIYDPDDFDSCKPVETEMLQKDGTWIYSVGGGIQYDLSSVFKKLPKEVFLINVSAFYTQGGTVNYMNTDVPDGHHATTAPPNRSGDLEASFINTQTQVIHKHHVGYVYSSYAQMMDYRITFTFRKPH